MNIDADFKKTMTQIAVETGKPKPTEAEINDYLDAFIAPYGLRLKRRTLHDQSRKEAAFHEAGHFVAALHYEPLWVRAKIFGTTDGLDIATYRVHGQTEYSLLGGDDPLSLAVVSWAGGLAGALCHRPVKKWQQENLTSLWQNIRRLHSSPQDKIMVDAYPNKKRSFTTAAEIVFQDRAAIAKLARILIKTGGASTMYRPSNNVISRPAGSSRRKNESDPAP